MADDLTPEQGKKCIIVERATGRVVSAGSIYDEPRCRLRRVILCGMPLERQPDFDIRAVSDDDEDWILRSDLRKLRLTREHFKRMPLIIWPEGTDEEIRAL